MGRLFIDIARGKRKHAQYLIDSLSVQGLLNFLIPHAETYSEVGTHYSFLRWRTQKMSWTAFGKNLSLFRPTLIFFNYFMF